MTIERRFLPQKTAAVETRADGDNKKIVGYAARFYNGTPETEFEMKPGVFERIMPQAFTEALAKDDVRALVNHDPSLILGRNTAGTLRMSVDRVGLRYEIDPPDTTAGRDARVSIERGDMTGSSFGFLVRSGGSKWRQAEGRSIRELHSVELLDVSVVTYPAYQASETGVGLRSQQEVAAIDAELAEWKSSRTADDTEKLRRDVAVRMAEIGD